MAKRGTLTHRRTRRLAAALGVMPPFALGLMEALWHVTAELAPTGTIGRLCDQDLADEMYWDGDAGELVAGLVKAGVLEGHPDHRLVVHGWSEHADNATRHKLARARMTFWDGEPPFKRRGSESDDGESASTHDQTPTDHAETPTADAKPRSDEIEPASDQRPATSIQQPASSDQRLRNTPPSPPAGAGGPRPTSLTVGDRHPSTGGQVLEVTDGVPIVAKASRQAYAVEARALADHARALGLSGDRAAERNFRELLRGGRRPESIRAALASAAAEARERTRELTPEELAEAEARKAAGLAALAEQRRASAPPSAAADPDEEIIRNAGGAA